MWYEMFCFWLLCGLHLICIVYSIEWMNGLDRWMDGLLNE